jgi:hypothetical protein
LSLGYQLARRGFCFISFDAWLHGERHDTLLEQAALPERGALYPPDSGLDTFVLFYRVIDQCRADADVDRSLRRRSRARCKRCGVTGFRWAAMPVTRSWELAQVRAAVPMIGVPSFTRAAGTDLLDERAFSIPRAAALDRGLIKRTAIRPSSSDRSDREVAECRRARY